MTKKNVLLVEPGYPNKYPPLGLMKIAAYHGPNGRGDNVRFVKGENPEVLAHVWDRVYVTTLFSFEWKRTAVAIDFALRAVRGQAERVFVGGIAASLMFDEFVREPRWAGIRFIRGLLDQPPGRSLQLSVEDGDFGANDVDGTPIEELVPDYSILNQIPYTYPLHNAYFGYASRGCVRKCSFCGVPKLEGAQREMPPITSLVVGVDEQFGPKKDLILMDNNVVASSRYKEVIAENSRSRVPERRYFQKIGLAARQTTRRFQPRGRRPHPLEDSHVPQGDGDDLYRPPAHRIRPRRDAPGLRAFPYKWRPTTG